MSPTLPAVVKNVPVLGPLAIRLRRKLTFGSSSVYWDGRYKSGGTSGRGSSGRLAEFKAEFLNDYVKQRGIASVIEHGCGDGAQLKLAQYPSYTGLDISPRAIELCRRIFAVDSSKQFFPANELPANLVADLAV